MTRRIFTLAKYFIAISVVVIIVMVTYFVYSYNVVVHPRYDMSERNKEGMKKVDEALANRTQYIIQKKILIDSMSNALESNASKYSLEDLFYENKKMWLESHLFTFSNSLKFSKNMIGIAYKLHDNSRKAEAKIYHAYSMCRGGFFKEAVDSLLSIRIDEKMMPDSVLSAYYTYGGRIWHDLADYTDYNYLSLDYKKRGNEWLEKALQHIDNKSDYYYVKGKTLLWMNQHKKARPYYMKAMSMCDEKDIERRSILYSTIANIDLKLGNIESATHYYIISVLNDVQNGIVETVSIKDLSNILFYNYDDVYKASDYLISAIQNAEFFGTRYRVNKMGILLPVFERQKQIIESDRKMMATWTSVVVCALCILILVFLYMSVKHSKALRNSREKLRISNQKLDEANRIKNQYLGYYMNWASEATSEINMFALLAEQKLNIKQYQTVSTLIANLKEKYEKKVVTTNFDKTFISIFPTFIDDFNKLMTDEGKQTVDERNSMTPVLRIFSLVRLGIQNDKQIAKCLDYSYNTVYNYRIRTKNKAINPDTFDADITKIGL